MYTCRGCEKIRHNQWYDLCYNPITKCTMKPQITGIFICIFPSCTKGGKTIIIFNVVKYTEACQQNRRERSGFGFDRRSNGMDELSSVVTEANDIKFASTKSWYARWSVWDIDEFYNGKGLKPTPSVQNNKCSIFTNFPVILWQKIKKYPWQ